MYEKIPELCFTNFRSFVVTRQAPLCFILLANVTLFRSGKRPFTIPFVYAYYLYSAAKQCTFNQSTFCCDRSQLQKLQAIQIDLSRDIAMRKVRSYFLLFKQQNALYQQTGCFSLPYIYKFVRLRADICLLNTG